MVIHVESVFPSVFMLLEIIDNIKPQVVRYHND